MATEQKSREVEFPVPDGIIAGQEWKQTANPTRKVLLLPGRQDGSNSFKKIVPLLPKDWWMIALEFPGDGLSTRKPPGSAYHSTDRLLDLKRVVKSLGWTHFTLIGHSMGAGLAQMYAGIFPEEVEALVSMDVVKQVSENTANTVMGLRKAYPTLASYDPDAIDGKFAKENAAEWYFQKNQQLIATIKNAELVSKEALDVLLERNIKQVDENEWTLRRDPRLAFPPIVRVSVDQHRDVYKQIKCEHLMLKSSQSPSWEPNLEKEFLEIYKTNCKRFEYKEVEGMSHVHLDNPERVAPLIKEFLRA